MQASNRTRREFILQSAKAASVLALLYGCGQSVKALQTSLGPEDINRLRKNFGGKLFVPGDSEYETARKVLNRNPETDKYPAIVAQVKVEADVLRCIDFSRQHGLEIAVRSGNHSFLGWGTSEKGMVIDLSKMKGVSIDPVKQTARVATGSTAEDILVAAAQYGLAPVLGQCGSVGAGFLLGGGLGWLSGKHGAGCDNLISARIVTADTRILKVDENTNQDLFWAIKGGGGNFGIATSFELKLHPLREVLAGSLVYPITKARVMLQFFKDFMATAPDELQADFYIVSANNGSVRIELVYSGDLSQGQQLLDTLRKQFPPEKDTIKLKPFSEIYKSDSDVRPPPCPFRSVKGAYIDMLSDEVIDLILLQFSHPPPSCALSFNLSHYVHGEVCRVAPEATAFNLRKQGGVNLVFWVQWKDAADAEACLKWHNKTFELLQKYSNGRIYANYMSSKGESAAKSVYGSNYARLMQIKRKYDPKNTFHLNQNIKPG